MTLNHMPTALRAALYTLACAGALALWMPSGPANAQAAVDPSSRQMDLDDWTGKPQSAAIARKEAGAALAQGRRECARERNRSERSACLRMVEADYSAMLKTISERTGRRGN